MVHCHSITAPLISASSPAKYPEQKAGQKQQPGRSVPYRKQFVMTRAFLCIFADIIKHPSNISYREGFTLAHTNNLKQAYLKLR